MYIQAVHIQNIKGLADVRLSFDELNPEGWHVILGDNSAGKTTLIRAVALALVGPIKAEALRENWTRWVHHREAQGWIEIEYSFDNRWDISTKRLYSPKLKNSKIVLAIVKFDSEGNVSSEINQAQLFDRVDKVSSHALSKKFVWGIGRGWFSASFGPSRRFFGGREDYKEIFKSNPRVARHLSAFSEEVALSEALLWLIEKKRNEQVDHVGKIFRFLNDHELLPHGVKLHEVNDKTLYFQDGDGLLIDARELSDGYRSVLSLTLELLRQMEVAYGLDRIFDQESGKVIAPGVVLVDEIDAHLHPSWQETVGRWFTDRFPKIQFIVATHSALVCRSIGPSGKVYRLRTPGTDGNQVEEVTGEDRDILWFGSLERALESAAFRLNIGRSEYGWERVEELRALVQAARQGPITDEQRARLQHLRAVLADAEEGD